MLSYTLLLARRGRVKCELWNCEWVFCKLKCELAHDWSAIFRTTRSLPSMNAIHTAWIFLRKEQQDMHTRMHNTYVCLAIYCMINCATITVVINVKKEFVHHLSCCRVSYTHRTMRFMALHACTSQINFKSCPVQCGSSVPVWVNTTSGLSALSADN